MIVCIRGSFGRVRSASLVVGLSALYEIPCWLPSFGDVGNEWWAVAGLPDHIKTQLRIYASDPVRQPQTPPGPPPAGSRVQYHGTRRSGIGSSMPFRGCIESDSLSISPFGLPEVRMDIWKVAPATLLELDELELDEKCIRVARHSLTLSEEPAE